MADKAKTEFKAERNSIVSIKLNEDFAGKKAGETIKMEGSTAMAVLKSKPNLGTPTLTSEVNMTLAKDVEVKVDKAKGLQKKK